MPLTVGTTVYYMGPVSFPTVNGISNVNFFVV